MIIEWIEPPFQLPCFNINSFPLYHMTAKSQKGSFVNENSYFWYFCLEVWGKIDDIMKGFDNDSAPNMRQAIN